MADTNNARAALMRLRDEVSGSECAYGPNCDQHAVTKDRVVRMIDRELAALPADEAAGASAGLVEAAEKVVGNAVFVGHQYEKSVRDDLLNRLREALAAERARKPQPDEQHPQDSYMALRKLMDERDKTIAELREADAEHRRLFGAIWLELGKSHHDADRETWPQAIAELRSELDIAAADRDQAMQEAAAAELRVVDKDREIAELREKLRVEQERHGVVIDDVQKQMRIVAKERERAEKAEAALADEKVLRANDAKTWGDTVVRLQSELYAAADSEHKEPDSEHNAKDSEHKDDDDTLREFVQWFESPGRHDIQPPVRAAYVLAKQRLAQRGDDDALREFVREIEHERLFGPFVTKCERAAYVLAKRALGVTGGGRKEVGDE